MKNKVVLVILDGFGLREQTDGNAIAAAHTPNWDRSWTHCPHTALCASGAAVGLPDGQMGNSEVGHTTIGAGRPIFGDLTKLNNDIASGAFYEREELTSSFAACKESGRPLHLMGLLSDGGVHSHNGHLYALLRLAKAVGIEQVYLHCILDGRDVLPTSALGYIEELEEKIREIGVGTIATVGGRYYFMDRDKRYERTALAYHTLLGHEVHIGGDPGPFIARCYQDGVTDEFVPPFAVSQEGRVGEGDHLLFFNFRPDRARQISHALVSEEFGGFERAQRPHNLHYATMTMYDETLAVSQVIYKNGTPTGTLGEVVSAAGKTQLRVAETEKYAHVTFFLNGGREEPFAGEGRVLISSPKVATYDLAVEMSAAAITAAAVEHMLAGDCDLIVMNYANCDMVGHTGQLEAAIGAVECIDTELGKLIEAAEQMGSTVLITADHGNAEQMFAPGGSAMTAHTTNLVPFVVVAPQEVCVQSEPGELADIAPTVLALLGIAAPAEMTGKNLII